MNYRDLIIGLIRESKDKSLIELLNDYNTLINMKNTGKIDINIINSISNKYCHEIDEVDRYRSIACNKVGKRTTSPNNITNQLDTLIDHLIAIMGLRYAKDYVDENIKTNLLVGVEKDIYEILCFIRDKYKS